MTEHNDSGRNVERRRFIEAAGATGVAALAGCTGNDDSEDGGTGATTGGSQDTITVQWAADPRLADQIDVFIEEMREAGLPDHIELDVIAGSNVTDDRQDQYTQWLNSERSEPDLLNLDSGWTVPFIVRGQTENLENHLSSDLVDSIHDEYFDNALLTAVDQDGALNALPMWVGLPAMMYRKDLVENAGYDPEGENWATESITWQKFSQVISDVLDENDDLDMGYTFQANDYEGLSCCNFNEFISSWGGAYFGGDLLGPIGDRDITLNEQPVLDSIRMIRTFIHGQDDEHSLDGYEGPISPESVVQMTEQTSLEPFLSGNAVANRNWPSFIQEAASDENFGEDLGVMPIPYAVTPEEATYEGRGGPVGALGGWHLAMNPYSEKKEAAAQVMEAMTADNVLLNGVFDAVGQIPPKAQVLASDGAQEIPVIGRYVDTLRVVGENAIPRPATAVWPQQSSEISGEVNSTYNQQKSPEDAMSDLEESLNSIEQSV